MPQSTVAPPCGASGISNDRLFAFGAVPASHRCISASSWQNRQVVSTIARLPSAAPTVVGDPSATRTVYIAVVLLIMLGIALATLVGWLWSRTRAELELFAPLEEMETRSWRKQDPAAQRRALDASRPAGALPVHPEVAEPVVEMDGGSSRPPVGFSDLVDVDDTSDDTSDVEVDPCAVGATDAAPSELLVDPVGVDRSNVVIAGIADSSDDQLEDSAAIVSDTAEIDLDDETADGLEHIEAVDKVGVPGDDLDTTGVSLAADVEFDADTELGTDTDTELEIDDANVGERGSLRTGRRQLQRFRRP